MQNNLEKKHLKQIEETVTIKSSLEIKNSN